MGQVGSRAVEGTGTPSKFQLLWMDFPGATVGAFNSRPPYPDSVRQYLKQLCSVADTGKFPIAPLQAMAFASPTQLTICFELPGLDAHVGIPMPLSQQINRSSRMGIWLPCTFPIYARPG